ncbi:MAG: hypothetical protein ACLQED_10510 [Desulfobaccales bacterium]|jgi:hypothetical protein
MADSRKPSKQTEVSPAFAKALAALYHQERLDLPPLDFYLKRLNSGSLSAKTPPGLPVERNLYNSFLKFEGDIFRVVETPEGTLTPLMWNGSAWVKGGNVAELAMYGRPISDQAATAEGIPVTAAE